MDFFPDQDIQYRIYGEDNKKWHRSKENVGDATVHAIKVTAVKKIRTNLTYHVILDLELVPIKKKKKKKKKQQHMITLQPEKKYTIYFNI